MPADSRTRVGIGWDVHPLVRGRALVLGGVRFTDSELGLAGHSDADVVVHAICDALLGALALGDIGEKFPDTDPAYKDVDSMLLLDRVNGWVKEAGYSITNVDCTVMSDAVHLGVRKQEMAGVLAKRLGLEEGSVSVKATRWEGKGTVGRGEVVACQAIVAVHRAASPGR